MDKPRILVLGAYSAPTFAVYHYLEDRFGVDRLVLEQPVNRRILLERRLKKLGIVEVAGQLAFQLLIMPVLRRSSAARIRTILQAFQLETSAPDDTRVVRVTSVNSPEAINLIEKLSPDIIVLAGTRILNKEFLGNICCPVLNIHAGITPLYRGVHGAYWALVEQKPQLCGVTLHRVDAGIDTGEVLAQRAISITQEDNFATYPWIQLGEGLKALAELLPDCVDGKLFGVQPMISESKLRHHPTLWCYIWQRTRNGVK